MPAIKTPKARPGSNVRNKSNHPTGTGELAAPGGEPPGPYPVASPRNDDDKQPDGQITSTMAWRIVQSFAQKYFGFSETQIRRIVRPSHPTRGAARDRHERAVGCGGRGMRERRTRMTRTAKTCGSGAAMLASSRAERSARRRGNKAVHRGERVINRKTIAQGKPGCLR